MTVVQQVLIVHRVWLLTQLTIIKTNFMDEKESLS